MPHRFFPQLIPHLLFIIHYTMQCMCIHITHSQNQMWRHCIMNDELKRGAVSLLLTGTKEGLTTLQVFWETLKLLNYWSESRKTLENSLKKTRDRQRAKLTSQSSRPRFAKSNDMNDKCLVQCDHRLASSNVVLTIHHIRQSACLFLLPKARKKQRQPGFIKTEQIERKWLAGEHTQNLNTNRICLHNNKLTSWVVGSMGPPFFGTRRR